MILYLLLICMALLKIPHSIVIHSIIDSSSGQGNRCREVLHSWRDNLVLWGKPHFSCPKGNFAVSHLYGQRFAQWNEQQNVMDTVRVLLWEENKTFQVFSTWWGTTLVLQFYGRAIVEHLKMLKMRKQDTLNVFTIASGMRGGILLFIASIATVTGTSQLAHMA